MIIVYVLQRKLSLNFCIQLYNKNNLHHHTANKNDLILTLVSDKNSGLSQRQNMCKAEILMVLTILHIPSSYCSKAITNLNIVIQFVCPLAKQ